MTAGHTFAMVGDEEVRGSDPPIVAESPELNEPAIELVGLGKRYWKLEEQAMLIRSLLPFARPKRSELWALRGINLEIAKGEIVGMIGRNGAGKTSILRLIAGVSRPTEGHLTVRGRIAPLLSLGVGFQKEMSGRENVYMNAMLLGLNREQIDDRFDDVVAFAELADFIDTPVKFYSSGMFMRLGFSVAVHTDPRVLLVDEVLAVGDSTFQAKCLERIASIREGGATVVMVSHSMSAIELLCPRAVVVRRGRLEFDGPAREAISLHHELLARDAQEEAASGSTTDHHERRHVGGARIIESQLLEADAPAYSVQASADLTLRVKIQFDNPCVDPLFAIQVLGTEGSPIYGCNTPFGLQYRDFDAGDEVVVDITFSARLGPGTYRLLPWVLTSDGRGIVVIDNFGIAFFVASQLDSWGTVDLNGRILLDGKELAPDASLLAKRQRVIRRDVVE